MNFPGSHLLKKNFDFPRFPVSLFMKVSQTDLRTDRPCYGDARMRLRKYDNQVRFFFTFSDQNTVEFSIKVSKLGWVQTYTFVTSTRNLTVLIWKWKKNMSFFVVIILFSKESKSTKRIWTLLIEKSDFLQPLTPMVMTWHLIILTAFSMFGGHLATRNCPVNEASMNLMIILGGLLETGL